MNKPVRIITGFLGAGKTTYLNHLIKANPNKRYAIIENEFGEKSIDSELIFRPEDGIVELNNGCLCCTLNDNLYDILNDLFDRREDFDEVIIEATGVADPAGLAEPFLTHPLIKEHFPLLGTICLIDTELIEEQIEETEEALKQLTFSDILLLNKADLVTSAYVEEVKKKMAAINPLASIYISHQEEFPNFDLSLQKEQIEDQLISEINKIVPMEGLNLKAPHHHHDHEHTPNVVSFCFTFSKPFDYDLLYHNLFVYLRFQSRNLFRMKGLLWLAEKEQQVVIQSVGKRMNFEEKRAWKEGETRESNIVFIGKDLKRKGIEQLLQKCLSKNASNTNKHSHKQAYG
tara:strand:+ start:7013 stop:8047 length:1035 start_codon:yes stop_codon:yes gene_type:complete